MSILQQELNNTISVLNRGGVVICPTDTIWGLSCDATQEISIKKIIELKNRPVEKKMLVLVSSFDQLKTFVNYPTEAQYRDIMSRFEDPVTFIFPKGRNLPAILYGDNGSIAIRMVKSGFAYEIIEHLRAPIISTSANISGHRTPKTNDDISPDILFKVDYAVDPMVEKELEMSQEPSKIIRIDADGSTHTIRG